MTTGPDTDADPPFGALALPPRLERLRRFGAGLRPGWAARRACSLIRRICLAGRHGPVDVEPFPGQSARLHPRDNLCEKRVFAAPQFWDAGERAALADAVARTPAPFRFVDAGANVGMYTLAVRAMGPTTGLAIEPDPENLRRLRANLAASGAGDSVTVAPVALGAAEGRLRLAAAGANRGEIALAAGGEGIEVPVRPLLALVQDAGMDRIDALKIDIEGAEAPVLDAFFAQAPRALWPGCVLIEARRGEDTAALAILRRLGYAEARRTRLNVILTAPGAGGGPAGKETDTRDGKA